MTNTAIPLDRASLREAMEYAAWKESVARHINWEYDFCAVPGHSPSQKRIIFGRNARLDAMMDYFNGATRIPFDMADQDQLRADVANLGLNIVQKPGKPYLLVEVQGPSSWGHQANYAQVFYSENGSFLGASTGYVVHGTVAQTSLRTADHPHMTPRDIQNTLMSMLAASVQKEAERAVELTKRRAESATPRAKMSIGPGYTAGNQPNGLVPVRPL